MPLEDIFSSKGRVRVLRTLLEFGELNISEIVRKTGLNHTTTNRHLSLLQRENLVQEKRFGRIRIFRLEPNNKKTELLRSFFSDWKEAELATKSSLPGTRT